MKIRISKSKAKDKSFIDNKIVEYNNENVPFTQEKSFIDLSYVIKNDQGIIIAGVNATLYCWHCLYLDVLWVSKEYRKSGLGTELINKLEKEAKNKGCYLIHLSSFDWQAKDFYLKHGYEIFGEIKDNPIGHMHYFIKKHL